MKFLKYLFVLVFSLTIITGLYADEILFVKQGELWAVVDEEGNTIHPARFDGWHTLFEGRKFAVSQNGEWALMDNEGKVLTPFKYKEIIHYPFMKSYAKVIVGGTRYKNYRNQRAGGKSGIIHEKDGAEVIPPIYDVINYQFGYFSVGLGVPNVTSSSYSSGGKWGLLNHKGQEIIPCLYNYCHTDGTYVNMGFQKKRSSVRLKDVKRMDMSVFESHQATSPQTGHYIVSRDGLFGIVDFDGHEVVPMIYEKLGRKFINGRVTISQGNRWGAYEVGRGEVVPLDYSRLMLLSDQGHYSFLHDGKWGVMDKDGIEIQPPVWDFVGHWNKDHFVARKDGKIKWHIIDSLGNDIFGRGFSSAHYDKVFYFIKQDDGKWFAMNPDNGLQSDVFENNHSSMVPGKPEWGGFSFGHSSKKYWISPDMEIWEYSKMEVVNDVFRLYTPFGIHIFSPSGEKLIDMDCEQVCMMNQGRFLIKKGSAWEIISRKGEKGKELDLKADNVGDFVGGFAYFYTESEVKDAFGNRSRKYGLLNQEGEMLLDAKYENVIPLSNGKAWVEQCSDRGCFWTFWNGSEFLFGGEKIVSVSR